MQTTLTRGGQKRCGSRFLMGTISSIDNVNMCNNSGVV
jgi:hypothetical protein